VISETTFAKKFTSFWNELLPNSKTFTRIVNVGFARCNEQSLPPGRKTNTALVNVLAYNLYRLLVTRQEGVQMLHTAAFAGSAAFHECLEQAVQFLKRFGENQRHRLPLSNNEIAASRMITSRLLDRYGWEDHLELDPAFDGCGCINPSCGDIYIGKRLIEVKGGDRSYNVTDFRQVVIYCALNHYSHSHRLINSVEIINPRLGTLFVSDIDQLAMDLSGLCALELFAEVRRFVVETDFASGIDA